MLPQPLQARYNPELLNVSSFWTACRTSEEHELETLWDHADEPTHGELETLYKTAKKNQ